MEDAEQLQYAIKSTTALFQSELWVGDEMQLKIWLEEKLFDMLQHDFNGLVNLLYRIDVYESKAKECFGKANKEIAICLAQLIWERQLQKAATRFRG